MKKLTLITFLGLFSLGMSAELFASLPVVVKKVTQTGDFMPPTNTRTPVTTFVIEVELCRKAKPDQFEVKISSSGIRSGHQVEFVDSAFDCFGPTRWQEVKLQTTELPLFTERVRIVNPVLALVEDKTTH